MSSEATPISPARFAEALKDLPLSTLHLKAAELRNSIAHLDYSNEQLKPFAEGRAEGTSASTGEPDQDCIDAINENEIVITRMEERIRLLKAEVEGRGQSWMEFRTAEEISADAATQENKDGEAEQNERLVNGTVSGENEGRSSAWTDGTFQTGRIVNGEVRMDGDAGSANTVATAATSRNSDGSGGRLDDETLRRAMEERMRNLGQEDDEDDGMHL